MPLNGLQRWVARVAIAPLILVMGGGDYSVLFIVTGASTLLGAAAILRVKGVR
jgi:hypothetical protein